ncbi:thioredoxin domain-containing protein [Ornithinibacillus sp. BX22]|uniref:Thioredoxin domain-containing protein n=2 Tax=Ornithinibacillus TaxID=484508 RepID=A0A923L767_9BACI|nr:MULTISPECIES: thioredoxin domain-containing protein [Ornithinibacillus]MBC5637667.1 thioredoxin domain-containing protein [Ornithinibacillus hominis]MBS3681657.1 thioredoxin domain-containing protein [Ornithinibacillus massiliensis]
MQENTNPNYLINEKSPYLLQHAYNPVNWYPWGDEAFEKAKQENKPIFLSIGYSTCHWCHVMAHESFEDEEVAQILNEHYISIKVDREERPDVDSIYMKVCQMMAGHGGWPLTIFMTPEKVPFYAGTYFPKESKYGRPGLLEALEQLHIKYTSDPEHISEVTESVKQALDSSTRAKSEHRLTKEAADQAYQQLGRGFDFNYGGFFEAPKFPQPQNLLFLLRYYHFTGKTAALKMVESSLQNMAAGGIWDHIGFGFARYSTDEKWLVPHFEKMLYDNALLLIAYTECYQVTKKPFYRKIAEQIIDFVKREMMSTEGAFYSAIDADSEGVEGKYYVWDDEEIFDILGEDLGDIYTTAYGITPYGNFEGKNIPNLIRSSLQSVAEEYDITVEALETQLEEARQKLLQEREKRVYPHVDDKILTSWNAMMIAGLAKASRVFQNNQYLDMAKTAISFVEKKLYEGDKLMARYRDGETKYHAYLDDYAYLVWAYLELYQVDFNLEYLSKGKHQLDVMIDLFWDKQDGGFFFSGKNNEQLISNDKEIYDGATPSGNSVAALMLVQMGSLTGETSYLDRVAEMSSTFYEDITRQPSAGVFFLQSVLLTENPSKEVVVLGESDSSRAKLLQLLHDRFIPEIALLVANEPEQFRNIAPFAAEYKTLNGQTTVYVCENFACQQPTNNMDIALDSITTK